MTDCNLFRLPASRFVLLGLLTAVLIAGGCRPGAQLSPEQQLEELKATAAAARDAGKLNDAFVAYKQAAQLAADDFDVTYGLAEVNTRLRNEIEALDWVNAALRLRPEDRDALELKGRLYVRLQRLPDAIRVLEQTVKNHPDHTLAWLNLAAAYHSSGRTADAVSAAKQAIASAPDKAITHFALGDIHYSRGEFANAESEYRIAVEKDPDQARAYLRLADLYIQQRKDLKQAREWAVRSDELYPGDGTAASAAAWALYLLDEKEDALSEMARAAADHPQNYKLWIRLGQILEDMGAEEQAKQAYQNAARFAPSAFKGTEFGSDDSARPDVPTSDAKDDT